MSKGGRDHRVPEIAKWVLLFPTAYFLAIILSMPMWADGKGAFLSFGWFLSCGREPENESFGIFLGFNIVVLAGIVMGVVGFFLSTQLAKHKSGMWRVISLPVFNFILFWMWYYLLGYSLTRDITVTGYIIEGLKISISCTLFSITVLGVWDVKNYLSFRKRNWYVKASFVALGSLLWSMVYFNDMARYSSLLFVTFSNEERAAWWVNKKVISPGTTADDANQALLTMEHYRAKQLPRIFQGLAEWKTGYYSSATVSFDRYARTLKGRDRQFFQGISSYLKSDYQAAYHVFYELKQWEFAVASILRYRVMDISRLEDHLNQHDLDRISDKNFQELQKVAKWVTVLKSIKPGEITRWENQRLERILQSLIPAMETDLKDIVVKQAPELLAPEPIVDSIFYYISLNLFLAMMFVTNAFMRDLLCKGFFEELGSSTKKESTKDTKKRVWLKRYFSSSFFCNFLVRGIMIKIVSLEPRPGLFTTEIKDIQERFFPLDMLYAMCYWWKAKRVLHYYHVISKEKNDLQAIERRIQRLKSMLIPNADTDSFDVIIALGEKSRKILEKYLRKEKQYLECRAELLDVFDGLIEVQGILGVGGGLSYYNLLGLKPGPVTEEKLKVAYRAVMWAIHPDHHSNNPHLALLAQHVNEAYGILKNPTEKEMYDRQMGFRF